jgi:hypothetical protein
MLRRQPIPGIIRLVKARRLWPREQGCGAASQDRPTADCRGIDAALLDRRRWRGEFFLACWPVDRVIRHTVDADKHPVAATTVLIATLDGPVTSSTTNSGGTRHLSGTPLVPMPLVT